MNTKALTLKELPEAVDAYLNLKSVGHDASRLIELIQNQTEYIQKRFWALVDAKVGA